MHTQILSKITALAVFAICLVGFVSFRSNGGKLPSLSFGRDTVPHQVISLQDPSGYFNRYYGPDTNMTINKIGLPRHNLIQYMIEFNDMLEIMPLRSTKSAQIVEQIDFKLIAPKTVAFRANLNLILADTLTLPDTIWFHRETASVPLEDSIYLTRAEFLLRWEAYDKQRAAFLSTSKSGVIFTPAVNPIEKIIRINATYKTKDVFPSYMKGYLPDTIWFYRQKTEKP